MSLDFVTHHVNKVLAARAAGGGGPDPSEPSSESSRLIRPPTHRLVPGYPHMPYPSSTTGVGAIGIGTPTGTPGMMAYPSIAHWA